jgi:hypothetical protein
MPISLTFDDHTPLCRGHCWHISDEDERELLNAVVALARGQLTQIASRSLPTVEHVGSPTIIACQILWLRLLEGLQALAGQLLGIGDQKNGSSPRLPSERFATVRSLACGPG